MPLYEYQCTACGHAFENLVRSADRDRNQKCPKCGQRVERKVSVFSAGAVQPAPAESPGMCGRCGGPGPCAAQDF